MAMIAAVRCTAGMEKVVSFARIVAAVVSTARRAMALPIVAVICLPMVLIVHRVTVMI